MVDKINKKSQKGSTSVLIIKNGFIDSGSNMYLTLICIF